MNDHFTCNDCGHEEVVPIEYDPIAFMQDQGHFVCSSCGSGDVSIEHETE